MKKFMPKAYLIYDKQDIQKNSWFINHMIEGFKAYDIELILIEEDQYLTIQDAAFILNRSRNLTISQYFEKQKIKVFNSSLVCLLGNNKYEAYEYFKNSDLNILPYQLNCIQSYPKVLKSLNGHGGSEVFLVNNPQEYQQITAHLNKDYLTQDLLADYGVDVRVYILDNQVYQCVKRVSTTSFKSNYSLGGEVSLYDLTLPQQKQLQILLDKVHFDFVGIDFLMDRHGNFYFNEIEDVVGTRMLYQLSNQDIILDYIKKIVSKL